MYPKHTKVHGHDLLEILGILWFQVVPKQKQEKQIASFYLWEPQIQHAELSDSLIHSCMKLFISSTWETGFYRSIAFPQIGS